MADWKQIPDTDVDPDAPVTSELMYALRDNPVAIAEGAVGAPKVMGQALGAMIALKQPSPLIITDLERAEALIVWGEWNPVIPGSGGSVMNTLLLETSTNGGASWSAVVTLYQYRTSLSDRESASAPVNVGGNVNAVRVSIGGTVSSPFISVACLQGVSP